MDCCTGCLTAASAFSWWLFKATRAAPPGLWLWPAMAVWQPLAALVPIPPLMASTCRRSGLAVLALALLAVFRWPPTSPPWAAHHVESRGTREDAVARAKEACTVWPSRETKAPGVMGETARGQDTKHLCKRCGLRRAKRRPKVSWEAMPWGTARQVGRQARWLLPQRSLAWPPSPPLNRVHTVMTRRARTRCVGGRAIRGAANVCKGATSDALTGLTMDVLLWTQDLW